MTVCNDGYWRACHSRGEGAPPGGEAAAGAGAPCRSRTRRGGATARPEPPGPPARARARRGGCGESEFPRTFSLQFAKAQEMRYGENPHQNAAFYVEQRIAEACIGTATQLQGKELSYNNIADTDAALECVKQFRDSAACVIVKHANPCGVALGSTLREAYELAYATDPESAFGGIIAFNRELDADTATLIVERQFVEVIIAPTASPAAVAAVCLLYPSDAAAGRSRVGLGGRRLH